MTQCINDPHGITAHIFPPYDNLFIISKQRVDTAQRGTELLFTSCGRTNTFVNICYGRKLSKQVEERSSV